MMCLHARCLILTLMVLLWSAVKSEARVFTAKDGRTIEAELVAYEDQGVRIKRSDTGQVFSVPYSSLVEEEETTLRAEAKAEAAKPKPIRSGSVQVELSRGMFSSNKTETQGLDYTYEQWGFNVVITNRGVVPLEKLRAEYVIFLDPSESRVGASGDLELVRKRGAKDMDDLAVSARTQFRTDTVEAVKVKLQPGWVWGDADKKRMMRDKLHGVWVRIFRGDELVAESVSPGGLNLREPWDGASSGTKARTP